MLLDFFCQIQRDHKRKVVQIIEVDAVADGLIRRVQAAQLQRVLVRARDRRHRLVFAKGLNLAARARRQSLRILQKNSVCFM